MRHQSYRILYNYQEHNTYLNLALKNLDSNNIENFNQITIRIYGVIEKEYYLNFLLENYTNKKLDNKTSLILKMAIYEHLYLDTVPDYAIISEYSSLCKMVNKKALPYVSYFLNNELVNVEKLIPKYKNEYKNISIEYSYPQWLVKKLSKMYPDNFLEIIQDTSNKKTTFVRKININDRLNKHYTKFKFPDLYTYDGNIVQAKAFKKQQVIIQDLGSYLITKLVDAKEEDMILDLCAAPGNKTMHIAQKAKHVIANEINESRYNLLKGNMVKYRINNVTCINCDATSLECLEKELNGAKFDKILIDAPCSGTGVLKSKPEIKNKLTIKDVEEIKVLQAKILKISEFLLKPEGELIYSTCSIDKSENIEQIKNFLNMTTNTYTEVKNKVVEEICFVQDEMGYTLLPNQYNSDGFYMCKLKKEVK